MPDYPPPDDYTGTPHRYLLPAESILWRVHSQKVDATDFTPSGGRGRLGRGRFDGCTTDSYASYHAGLDAAALLADLLLRGLLLPEKGFRVIRRTRVLGLRASAVSTTVELSLVSLLNTAALTAVAQDRWLITADETYPGRLGEWANWLRENARWASGFIWPAPYDHTRQLVVLFGDRCPSGALRSQPEFAVNLDDEYGAVWLNGILPRYRARIAPPRNGR